MKKMTTWADVPPEWRPALRAFEKLPEAQQREFLRAILKDVMRCRMVRNAATASAEAQPAAQPVLHVIKGAGS